MEKKKKEFKPDDYEIADSDLFSNEEIIEFLKRLVDEKDQILAKTKNIIAAGEINLDTNEMADEVDLASAAIEQNLTLKLLDRDRHLINEIDRAIDKIAVGDYGYCEGTGDPIPKRRLELSPWTRYSVKHQEQLEKSKKSGRGATDE